MSSLFYFIRFHKLTNFKLSITASLCSSDQRKSTFLFLRVLPQPSRILLPLLTRFISLHIFLHAYQFFLVILCLYPIPIRLILNALNSFARELRTPHDKYHSKYNQITFLFTETYAARPLRWSYHPLGYQMIIEKN